MIKPGIPANEKDRIRALHDLGALDTPPDEDLDNLTRLVAELLDVPISLVSLVDSDRQWFKSRHGTDATGTPRDVSFCGHIVQSDAPVVVPDALADERFFDNPMVAGEPGLRFYAGYPLRTDDGLVLGTLCAVDTRPRQIDERKLEILRLLSRQAMALLYFRKVAAEHERSNAFLHAVLNQLQVGTIFVDDAGKVEYATDRCLEVLAPKVGKDTRLTWADLIRVEAGTARLIEETIRSSEAERVRMRIHVPARGGMRWFDLDIRDDAGDASKRILYLYDVEDVVKLRESILADRYGPIIGKSDSIRSMVQMIERVAAGEWTVMIEGETGSGKELAARAIHDASPRKNGPFIAVNCAGLGDSLLASQLFGHRKGSFTGAVSDQEGFFEAAHGGTLFLDEIGDVSPQLQASLLRVLQEKEILRVGDTRPRKVDVRVVVATNRNLQADVAAGRFRQDLLYRIRVARLVIPPLRDRCADIPLLAAHFLEQNAAVDPSGRVRTLHPATLSALVAHSWPGNVRELKSALDFAWIHADSDVVMPSDLPTELAVLVPVPSRGQPASDEERKILLNALEKAGGNRNAAARLMGTSRATFFRKLKKHGMTS